MTFTKALFAVLSGDAPLVALVPAGRITPEPLPQNQVLPAITYGLAGGDVAHAFGADPNIYQPRVSLTIWAQTLTDAESVQRQLRRVVRNIQSSHTDTDGTLRFQGSYLEFEPFHLHEFETQIHRLTFDITCHYSLS
jgi:hypothetical protein